MRYQPEDDLRALFQRDVDYCSGVFAIIARRHFEALGGLDEAYALAYFEGTDFCMRLRGKGCAAFITRAFSLIILSLVAVPMLKQHAR